MLIRVDEVIALPDGKHDVRFTCACGAATGHWIGSKLSSFPVPKRGTSYSVELAFDDVWIVGENLVISDRHEPAIEQRGTQVILNCQIDSLDEDGLFIRFGHEGLVMIGLDDVDRTTGLAAGQWLRMALDARALQIYAHDAWSA